jgi:hypothetical protein
VKLISPAACDTEDHASLDLSLEGAPETVRVPTFRVPDEARRPRDGKLTPVVPQYALVDELSDEWSAPLDATSAPAEEPDRALHESWAPIAWKLALAVAATVAWVAALDARLW